MLENEIRILKFFVFFFLNFFYLQGGVQDLAAYWSGYTDEADNPENL